MLLIGVAGGSGSGKSTIVEKLLKKFGDDIGIIRHDDYYRFQPDTTYEERSKTNYDCPDAFETSLLVRQLKELKLGKSVMCPVYDFTVHNRSDEVKEIKPKPVMLIDGILVLADDDLRSQLDMKIFVDTDADIRILRRVKRDMRERGRTIESIISQYIDTVKPMHEKYVEPSKRFADIIIPEGGHNAVAMSVIENYIKNYLQTCFE